METPTCPLPRGDAQFFTKATEFTSDPVKVGLSPCAMAPHPFVYSRCQRRRAILCDVTEVSNYRLPVFAEVTCLSDTPMQKKKSQWEMRR